MKAFTGFAIGTLAVLGAVAAVFIYLKKKTEKEIAYDQFDDIMDSDEDFDDEFFDDDDEVLDPAGNFSVAAHSRKSLFPDVMPWLRQQQDCG